MLKWHDTPKARWYREELDLELVRTVAYARTEHYLLTVEEVKAYPGEYNWYAVPQGCSMSACQAASEMPFNGIDKAKEGAEKWLVLGEMPMGGPGSYTPYYGRP